jgi:glycosyltransferase involved in cell wall biosynthesis
MKIAIYHNLPSGGAKRALYEWTRRLAVMHVLDVYTLSTADHAFCDVRPFVETHRIYEFTPYRSFESPLGRLNRLQRWRDLGALTQLGRRIAGEVNNGGYDVLFAHPCRFTFIPALLRFIQIPTIYYLHEPFGPGFARRVERPYRNQDATWKAWSLHLDPFYRLYTRRLARGRAESLKRTTRLLANSAFTQQQMALEYGVEAPVCHYGVNAEGFSPQPGLGKDHVVLSVGALTPRKGFDFLVESLAHIPAGERPALKLVCNGEVRSERRYVRELAAEHGVDLQIRYNLDSAQLSREYNRAKLCLYAPVLEPFGLVPLESMACGTPVVGVREGGVCESVVDGVTGVLVDRDPAWFARAVRELLADAERLERYGHQGRQHVLRNWTWEASVAQVERHLADLASAPARPV